MIFRFDKGIHFNFLYLSFCFWRSFDLLCLIHLKSVFWAIFNIRTFRLQVSLGCLQQGIVLYEIKFWTFLLRRLLLCKHLLIWNTKTLSYQRTDIRSFCVWLPSLMQIFVTRWLFCVLFQVTHLSIVKSLSGRRNRNFHLYLIFRRRNVLIFRSLIYHSYYFFIRIFNRIWDRLWIFHY